MSWGKATAVAGHALIAVSIYAVFTSTAQSPTNFTSTILTDTALNAAFATKADWPGVFAATNIWSAVQNFSSNLNVTSGLLSTGSNGGSGGTLAFNGATSGASTVSVAATGGHLGLSGGTAPTLTAGCNGAGSSVSGNDQSGTVTGQTAAATTCTLTFGTAFGAAPNCVAMGVNSPLTGAVTPSASTLVVSFASTASYKFTYFCLGT